LQNLRALIANQQLHLRQDSNLRGAGSEDEAGNRDQNEQQRHQGQQRVKGEGGSHAARMCLLQHPALFAKRDFTSDHDMGAFA
jgi:hypothetical protein